MNYESKVSSIGSEIAGCICFDKNLPASDDLWDFVHTRVMQFIPNLLEEVRKETIKECANICRDESDYHCDHEVYEKCCKQGCIALSGAERKIRELYKIKSVSEGKDV